jgi:hypothetical protein
MWGDPMEIVTLAHRMASSDSKAAPPGSAPSGKFAEIFAHGDASVEPIPDLMSAVYKIRQSHPRGADLILIGMSHVQGMKISQDLCGFITVLIGLSPTTFARFEGDDEVCVAFDHGALRPGAVIGFLWEAGDGQDSPPKSNSTLTKTRLDGIRHLRRLNLA